jgi:hypothetical protein
MSASLALHTAARRYLIDRRAMWIEAYSTLPNAGRAADGYNYQDRAKDIFPRYNVLNAIRVMTERLDPDRLPAVDEVVAFIHRAAFEATDFMSEPPNGEIEAGAMDDERHGFAAWLDQVATGRLAPDPLPYRRTLSDEEATAWWKRIEHRWPVEHGGWWEPIIDQAATDVALVLESDCFWDDNDAGPATRGVRDALDAIGVGRVIELREFGPGYEIAVEWLMPVYNGAEGMFTAGDCDWLVFASHEGVAALGGRIVVPFKRAWPDWYKA